MTNALLKRPSKTKVFFLNSTKSHFSDFRFSLCLPAMLRAADEHDIACVGECLHQVERFEDDDDEDEEDEADDNDETSICDFVCQFISMDCKAANPCVAQPCANFPLCGNRQPQWVLDCHGGLCVQPCDMMYGRVFEFSRFADDDTCPVCLEAGAVSVVYPCQHMVCARCYARTAFNDTVTLLLKRCPMCRLDSVPLGVLRRGRHSSVRAVYPV
jgi:hypothetical protein